MIKKELVKGYSFLSSLFFCFTGVKGVKGVKGAKVLPPTFTGRGECSSIYTDPLGGFRVRLLVDIRPSGRHIHTFVLSTDFSNMRA